MDKNFSKISDVLKKFETKSDKDKYISQEFQKYGYDLAVEFGDLKRKSYYIKLAKETPRSVIESAKSFVKDATTARNKAALFVWKVNELKKLAKNKK